MGVIIDMFYSMGVSIRTGIALLFAVIIIDMFRRVTVVVDKQKSTVGILRDLSPFADFLVGLLGSVNDTA